MDKQIAAFYNLQNPFVNVDDLPNEDDDFLPESHRNWSDYWYLEKLEKVTRSIVFINQKRPLAVVGVSEIENKTVLTDLVNQYAFMRDEGVHFFINHWPSRLTVHFDKRLLYFDNKKSLYRPNGSYSGNQYHGGFPDHLLVFAAMDLP